MTRKHALITAMLLTAVTAGIAFILVRPVHERDCESKSLRSRCSEVDIRRTEVDPATIPTVQTTPDMLVRWTAATKRGKLMLLIDSSIYEDCKMWRTNAYRSGETLRIHSRIEEVPADQCMGTAVHRWDEAELDLPAGFYQLTWTRMGDTIASRRIAIDPGK